MSETHEFAWVRRFTPVDGIQINVCRNTLCANFGVSPSLAYRETHGQRRYRIVATGRDEKALACMLCGLVTRLKSNRAVAEEYRRHSALREPELARCPNETCTEPRALQRFGTTHSGSPRFRCKRCGKTFSVPTRPTWKQKAADKNTTILRLLVNKMPMRRMLEVADVSAATLYRKIGFARSQCTRFAMRHEQTLPGRQFENVNLGTDRQDYLVNWGSHVDRRSFMLRAFITAENSTGYVLLTNMNFDGSVDPMAAESDARARGDYDVSVIDRHHARIWLAKDYLAHAQELSQKGRSAAAVAQRAGPGLLHEEDPFFENFELKRPTRGVQVRQEYATLAHFVLLKRMLASAKQVTLCIDDDQGLRHASLGVFCDWIPAGRCAVLQVDIDKGMTIDRRELAVMNAKAQLDRMRKQMPGASRRDAALSLLERSIAAASSMPPANRWVTHPLPHRAEPRKRVLLATPTDADEPHQIARLMLDATLSNTDRFMMIVRRRLSLLERPLQASSTTTRTWYSYSPYNPEVACAVLDILRVVFNYHIVGEDRRTPAMRLGLADKPYSLDEILAEPRAVLPRTGRVRSVS